MGLTILCIKLFVPCCCSLVFDEFFFSALEDGVEELVAEKDVRRQPFFRVGDTVEAQYTEDQLWYRAVVDERLGNQYVVTFTEYGNSQQCSADFLRPLPEVACGVCGGPPEFEGDSCLFCGAKREGAGHAQAEGAEETETAAVEHEVGSGGEEKSSQASNEREDLQEQVERLTRENAELRERLHEAMAAQQRTEAELEALKSANKNNRLRQSHSKLRSERAPTATDKPLPRPPPRGLLRDSSATKIGAGRGK
jgi:hypothetical protein